MEVRQQPSAGGVLRQFLSDRGWTQADLASVIGKTTAAVNEVVQGKRRITSEMSSLLAAAFGNDSTFWLKLQADRPPSDPGLIATQRRSQLFDIAPIREMVRRGWINDVVGDLSQLESELRTFFGVDSLDSPPSLPVATRKSGATDDSTPSQRAWCFRARNLASDILACPFDPNQLDSCLRDLQALMMYGPETRKVAETLGRYGIRFVVVEPLSGSRIDGAAMWIDRDKPVIAMSLRMDRIDSFWFTLFHEFAHIRHEDIVSVDSDLTGESATFSATKSPVERRADNDAAAMIVAPETLISFIHRVGPLYSKVRIVQFAHRVKVHPGIVVGQLQHRGEIPYRSNRDLLIKIRKRVIPTSLTDGWGHTVS